jgi:cytochrome c553
MTLLRFTRTTCRAHSEPATTRRSTLAAAAALALLASAGQLEAGSPHFDYLMHCGGCHNVQGEGAPPMVPSLRETLGALLTLEGGRDYLVRVPGAYQTPVSDAELAALMNFVLTTFNAQSLPEDFTPYTGEEVATYRSWPILSDPLARRADLWLRSAGGAAAPTAHGYAAPRPD